MGPICGLGQVVHGPPLPLAQAVSPAPPKGGGAPDGAQSMSDGPPLLLLAFLLVSSVLTEDYVTSKEGRSGVLPKAAVDGFWLPSFSQQGSALCRLDSGVSPGCFCFI